MHFADRLLEAIEVKNAAVCVGLDPVVEKLPAAIRRAHGLDGDRSAGGKAQVTETQRVAGAAALESFCLQVMEVVAPLVPAVKINIAFFERYGPAGVDAYERLVTRAHEMGLMAIGDVKRGDIGNTSLHYAEAHLDDTPVGRGPDAITISPYFGWDSVSPFVEAARRRQAGLFVLVQTSNPSAREVQDLRLEGGETVSGAVARLVAQWADAEGMIGARGFSLIGAVVSPRDVASTRRIRALMPHSLFLVPGFGAQGRTAEEVSHCFRPDGRGAIIAASRSVLFAYESSGTDAPAHVDWRLAVRQACVELIAQVRAVVPGRP